MLQSPNSDDQVELQKGQESEHNLPDTPRGRVGLEPSPGDRKGDSNGGWLHNTDFREELTRGYKQCFPLLTVGKE